jgi:ectoine hydroxylase-related dioxygenase (phytanoyl-CoA dioxygenase family)
MTTSGLSIAELKQIEDQGYIIVDSGLDAQTLRELDRQLDTSNAGQRNLLDLLIVRRLARSNAVRGLMEPVLGPHCFAVRGILFKKTGGANWKVSWHQDCVIAVTERKVVSGWGPWSIKDGAHHVRPSSELMSRTLAIRIHVDDCGSDNGPLRVIPSSHKRGFLSDWEIQQYPKDGALTCTAIRGEALLMRPLLLHSSSVAKGPNARRVVHLEFAADELPCGLAWRDRV